MSSSAVTTDRISRIVGYVIKKGNFSEVSPNLPQRIAILGEANDANQASLSLLPQQITSAQQAAQIFGAGSPIHIISRILFPYSGDGIGGIPVYVYPQAKAVGSTYKVMKVLPVGVATANTTHYLVVAGREGLDAQYYAINIVAGDTTDVISVKIANAVNAVYGCPFMAGADAYEAILTSRWSGLTANGLSLSVDTNGNTAGISYTITTTQTGSGTPDIAGALNQFNNDWNTIVVNSYGTISSIMTSLEQFNGIPDPTTPTGRYAGIILKPFIAITGSVADDPSSVTDTRLNDVTIAIAPAPASAGLAMEAAANMTLLFALQAQNSPHLDVSGQSYPDMPVPASIGSMAAYNSRDVIVKKGCSTVMLNAGKYQIQDFVTTYHPVGENPPQFRYCSNLNIDWNVRFQYYLKEQIFVIDHAIVSDDDIVTQDNVIQPKTWKAEVDQLADDLAKKAIITDAKFMQDSISVNIGLTNPDRLETFFRYKRRGIARISSTTAEAGFNFGTV
jgi:phage tail sheath gpL-like